MPFYEDFSKVYDQIMDQDLYERWLKFSQRHFSSSTKTILELASGSGELALRFEKAGYEVTGLDISEEMLTLARKKSMKSEFFKGDMRDFDLVKKFDAITCYSDSLCYLANLEELSNTFQTVYRHLNDGGCFIFDMHSIYQIDEIFPGYSYHENAEDFAFLWDSYKGEEAHSIEHQLSFFIKTKEESFVRKDELHLERTYEISEILKKLNDFSSVEVFADFEDQAPLEDSARWFFVCQK